ncbi:MAG TPA: biopolymer transporter ExbD [Pyrinomonadaceae bacterium]|nr:biopolymer transporter ExbD [Pyrinomonadaceae bacterium]
MSEDKRATPVINVTPLIDVLLVLLIIFMVVAPLKPHRFMTKLPAPPVHTNLPNDPLSLVVTIQPDRTLMLNSVKDMGTVNDLTPLRSKLRDVFEERLQHRAYRPDMLARFDLPERDRIQKTVFIKAPRSIPYGEVTRVIDGLKGAGADPIGLQLDGLN